MRDTDDPQAMTAGPRTAEGRLAFKRSELERARDLMCAEREADAFRDGFAQGVAAARAAVEAAYDAPFCDCDWMETGPTYPCGCGEHEVRPYRDDARHFRGQHWRDGHAIRAALDSTDRP